MNTAPLGLDQVSRLAVLGQSLKNLFSLFKETCVKTRVSLMKGVPGNGLGHSKLVLQWNELVILA